jgi:serine/threonine-protein kinase
VEAFLGSGAFGNVYLAHHRTMRRRRVAIKQLRMSEAPPSIVKRFIHESYAMGELYHPNVVLIYELIEPEMYPDIDTYYIVMEYVDGGTLLDWMNTPERPLASLSEQIRILKAVCRGLAMAHQEGIFHRDIKPENILLNRDGSQIKIGDWGLAHLESHKMTVLGDVLGDDGLHAAGTIQSGSPSMPMPVQNLYSLGVFFYEMVTGHVCLDLESIGNQAVMEFCSATLLGRQQAVIDARGSKSLPGSKFSACQEHDCGFMPTKCANRCTIS